MNRCTYFKRGAFILFALFVLPALTFAQQTRLSGAVETSRGAPVSHASVTLVNGQGHVIAFSSTGEQGKFVLVKYGDIGKDSLYIAVNCLGYKKARQPVLAGKNSYDFLMEEVSIELKEVKVKKHPLIQSMQDTLRYDVSSFAYQEDRSIGDVIRHMPGMEVADNGQISYNGKTISNLYIQGDDLMDGRYGLATKAITKEMIKSVDVMQGYQPVEVLRNKVLTDNVAVNLVLKDENSIKISGQAMLGGGLPKQYDIALNAILLNKKIKMLNSLEGNNSGVDYRDEFKQYSAADFLSNSDNARPPALLSAGTVGDPDLPRRNYYLNRSGIININDLYNTKSGLQLRSNLQVFSDRSLLNYTSRIDNYLTADTVSYYEVQAAVRKIFSVNSSLTATVNKKSYYFNDNLHLNYNRDVNNSYLSFNSNAFNQYLAGHTPDISNNLTWTPALQNQDLLNVTWYINFYNNPQHLYVGSGLNNNILNDSISYAGTNQQVATPALFSSASAWYLHSSRLIKQIYQLGLINEIQQLNSELSLDQLNGSVTPYQGDAGNALHWNRQKAFINSTYNIKQQNWEASLSLPIIWQTIHYRQAVYSLSNTDNNFFVNPSAHLKYFLNNEDYLQANYSYTNNTGNISGVYRGAILTNYRTFNANVADLQQKSISSTGINYNFQRSIIMLFINAGLNYSKVTVNSILSSLLTNTIQRTVVLPYQNDQSTMRANVGISKYIFALSSTVSLKSSWSKGLYNQFINNEMLPFKNYIVSLNSSIETKVGNVTIKYTGNEIWNSSRQKRNDTASVNSRVKRFDQILSLEYTPKRYLFITLNGRDIYNAQASAFKNNYAFFDSNIRCKLSKWRADLELTVSNIFNLRNYKLLTLSSNQLISNNYDIRGRMLLLRATFNL